MREGYFVVRSASTTLVDDVLELEARLQGITPQGLAVAELVSDKRELGLNWRIDAAKDVADMDFIREADPPDRAARFVKEMAFVKSFWADMTQAIRKESPKAVVIPEWTDFVLLSDSKTAVDVARSLYEDNTFSGTPNMQYLYSPAHQLFHYAGRPDEFGASQMPPSGFVESVIRPMTRNIPVPVARQSQNLTSSHDYMTSSHVMLMNPAIMMQDQLKWWGLKDDLKEASDELASKACFDELAARSGNVFALQKRGLLMLCQTRHGLDEEALALFEKAYAAWKGSYHAIGNGGNPPQDNTPGGGSGGAIYNDGNTMTLSVCGTRIEHNQVNTHGSAIFFVSNDKTGDVRIDRSIIAYRDFQQLHSQRQQLKASQTSLFLAVTLAIPTLMGASIASVGVSLGNYVSSGE